MNKRLGLLLIPLIIAGLGTGLLIRQKVTSPTSLTTKQETPVKMLPSATLKKYTDASGFSFTYPDNLSITNNETKDDGVYADIELDAKETTGGLHLKITDSQFTSIDQWAKGGKEVSFGSLKAQEIKDKNKILLGALDQGVLFTIEVTPENQEEFWLNVYNTVRQNFSFNQAPSGSSQVAGEASDEVVFEGEEVIE